MVNGMTFYYMGLDSFKYPFGDQIISLNECLYLLLFIVRESGVLIRGL